MAKRNDIGAMGDLADRLGELAQVPSRASRAAADGINAALEEQFENGVDPYGNAWEPLMQSTIDRGRSNPPLTDTGDMRDGTYASPARGAGIELTAPFPSAIHMTGSVNMASRPMLPTGDELPPKWQAAIEDALDDAFKRAMGGRRA